MQGAQRRAEIRIGTSGWSYPSGRGSWNGVFYPSPRPAGFDELVYYAERFDTVEVNSTFYRVPSPATTRRWAERTPPRFEFAVKLFQQFTHPRMFAERSGGEASIGPADVDAFRRAIDPLAVAGKLGPLLAQFPPSFVRDEAAVAYLGWLLETFGDHALAVELRHRSWSDAADDTRALLDAAGATWVQIDEPKFRSSIRQDFRATPGALFYARLHGRNAGEWWDHGRTEDRYDYLYSSEELEPFAEAVADAARAARKIYLLLNNHFEAKAVANAAMLKHRLGQPVPGAYPEAFLSRFPALAGTVTTSARRPGPGSLF